MRIYCLLSYSFVFGATALSYHIALWHLLHAPFMTCIHHFPYILVTIFTADLLLHQLQSHLLEEELRSLVSMLYTSPSQGRIYYGGIMSERSYCLFTTAKHSKLFTSLLFTCSNKHNVITRDVLWIVFFCFVFFHFPCPACSPHIQNTMQLYTAVMAETQLLELAIYERTSMMVLIDNRGVRVELETLETDLFELNVEVREQDRFKD